MSYAGIFLIILVGAGLVVGWRSGAADAKSNTLAPPPSPPKRTLTELLKDPGVARFVRWQEANALPAIGLTAGGPAPDTPGGSRIGGPVWLPKGEDWPEGRDGKPLSFLAQIDFATLPQLPDYPRTGVLQFFIGRDDLYGANFEKPSAGNFRVIYRETLDGPGTLHHPKPKGDRGIDDFSPLYDEAVAKGVLLTGKSETHLPSIDYWAMHRDLPELHSSKANEAVWDYYDADAERDESRYSYGHHIGGHVSFTQGDYRDYGQLQDYDRVLLQLWSNTQRDLMWGDMGQGNFLIRRSDLLKRDFSKVIYQWDCY